MKRYELVLCVLSLLSPAAVMAQEEVWEEDEYDEYEAYFGRTDGAYEPGPSSLAEAKKEGRGYRIGSGGVHDKHQPEAVSASEVHVVQEGDTLWDITDKYFQDPWRWPEVWAWNPEITNPHWIYPLDQIRLSATALEQDRAMAAQGTDRIPVGPATVRKLGSGQAQRVNTRKLGQGTVFLRDQAYLDDDALKSAGRILSSAEEQMFLSFGDDAYISVAEGETPKPGDQFTIFRRVQADEREEDAKGELVRVYGTIQVRSFDPDKRVARGIIVESLDAIERGFGVARVDRRFDLVPPRKNGANVIAKILASTKPVDMMVFGDVVFLDVGEGHGIAPGNRFFVVRRGDQWTSSLQKSPKEMGNTVDVKVQDPDELPKEVVAELRVIKVRPEYTVTLVVRSDTDLQRGDLAEMRVGY